LIHNPESILFAWAQDEEEGAMDLERGHYITVDGNVTEILSVKDLEDEAEKSALGNYQLKTLNLYVVIEDEKNIYSISAIRVNRNERVLYDPSIVFGSKREREISLKIENEYSYEEVIVYYNDPSRWEKPVPALRINVFPVIPNIAYRIGDKNDFLIKRGKRDDLPTSNSIEIGVDEIEIKPVFLRRREYTNNELKLSDRDAEIENIQNVFDRNKDYLVKELKLNREAIVNEKLMDWTNFSINPGTNTIEITTVSGSTIEAKINSNNTAPIVTVRRHVSNQETGYYIEDHYSSNVPASYRSIRKENENINTGNFDVLESPYKIPIIHYTNQSDVRLLLTDVTNNSNSIPVQYIVDGQRVILGQQFHIQTQPHGTILDIKDTDGNIKGHIEFRQITETPLEPTLNFVTINARESETNFSIVVSDVNAIYNTMNVFWQEGVHLILEVNEPYIEDLQNKIVDVIIDALRSHPQYRKNQYYMIVSPQLNDGFANYTLEDNYFFTPDIYDKDSKRMPAHELGHCSGLDEYVVNIGLVPKEERNRAGGNRIQLNTSNVMGYSTNNIDFYSWQILIIRQHIIERINAK